MKYELALYYYPECPFCRYVLNKIEQLNLKSVEYHNTRQNPSDREKLVSDTGRGTVPCLYINNSPMHESSDIISWLEQHKNELS